MIISFAWTTPALLAGSKSVTRREWDYAYAQSFKRGMLVDAWDKSPRYGGKKVGTIRLTADPSYEAMRSMPDDDYEREGFAYLDEHPELTSKASRSHFGSFSREAFDRWRNAGGAAYVVRFELVEVLP